MESNRSSIRTWLYTHRTDVVLALVIFGVAFIPRVVGLGTFLTADEKNWMGRSYEFIRAFKDVRFNDMLQTTHPGVTTLWLSGLGITARMFLDHVPFTFRNVSYFATAAQFPIALANAFLVPSMYVLLRVLLPRNRSLALLSCLFIALNPFIVGYSRVSHVDALLGGLLVSAALSVMIYAKQEYNRTWLVVAAAISALAFLTKFPAIFIIPFFGLVVLAQEGRRLFAREVFAARLRDGLLWLLMIGLLVIVLFPALLWVPNPKGNIEIFTKDIGTAASTPHNMNEDYTVNPWHYPAALISRTNPLALILSVIAVVTFVYTAIQKRAMADDENANALWLCIGFTFFFVLMMTLGAKKGDRYIIPVFFMLDIIAAFGLVYVSRWITNTPLLRNIGVKQALQYRYVVAVLGVIVVGYLAITDARYHPYAIAYSNPLFPDNLSQELGWGEGLDQVGAWLSENAPQAFVASWYPEELGAFTSAKVLHINAHEQPVVEYIVLYRNMFGRAPDHYANDFLDEYFKKRNPVFVAHVAGKEFAWVYEKRSYPQVVGELLPGLHVGQELTISRSGFAGIQVLVATYNGRATGGSLVVDVRDEVTGKLLRVEKVPVASIEDDVWHTVRFSEPQELEGKTVFVEVYAEGSIEGNAPTIRFNGTRPYTDGIFALSKTTPLTSADIRDGSLGVRVVYEVDGQLVNEEQDKLLSD